MSSHSGFICLACGGKLPEPLQWAGSLRCHDCRKSNAPLHVEHARWERALRLRRAAAGGPSEELDAA